MFKLARRWECIFFFLWWIEWYDVEIFNNCSMNSKQIGDNACACAGDGNGECHPVVIREYMLYFYSVVGTYGDDSGPRLFCSFEGLDSDSDSSNRLHRDRKPFKWNAHCSLYSLLFLVKQFRLAKNIKIIKNEISFLLIFIMKRAQDFPWANFA